MSNFRALTIQSGITTQIQNANSLIVGSGVTTATGNLVLNSADGYIEVAANKDLKAAVGTSAFDFSNSTGTFKTSTGAVTVGGVATFTAAGTALIVNNDATVTGALTAGSLKTASIDTATGVPLVIGSTTTTAVQIGAVGIPTRIYGALQVDGTETIIGTTTFQDNASFWGDVTVQDGYHLTMGTTGGNTGNFLQRGTGTFGTGTGAVSLNGNTTVTSGKSFTVNGGDLTQSGGAVSLTGNASSSFTTTAGTLTLDGYAGLNLQTGVTPTTRLAITDSALTIQSGVTLTTTGTGMIDLPLQFKINNVAVSSNVTAANLSELTGGGVTTLHSHAAPPATDTSKMVVNSLTTATVDGYLVAYVSADGVVSPAKADAMATANIFGVSEGVSGSIVIGGVATLNAATFVTSCPVAGTVLYLSSATAGKVTDVAPSASGEVVVRLGVVLNQSTLKVLIQPAAPIQL